MNAHACKTAEKLGNTLVYLINKTSVALDHPISSTDPTRKALHWKNLRNVWLDNINSEIAAHLKELLEEHVETIDRNVRANYDLVGINRAIEKNSIEAKYPKGKGDSFRIFVEECHDGDFP